MATQKELMHDMLYNTHVLWNGEFLKKINSAFNVDIQPATYKANPRELKGLTLNNGAKSTQGMACFDLAEILCRRLNVEYESKMGRGFQVRSCIDALRAAGYGSE